MPTSKIGTGFPLLDAILSRSADALGPDLRAYRNHCCRVMHFCGAFSGNRAEDLDKIAIAAAFHDLGIWTEGTFDYLGPSQQRAGDYLDQEGKNGWRDEVSEMIGQHHKISRYRLHPEWLVEPFRKADWVDVSLGRLTFGLDASFVKDVLAAFPNAGFHRRLTILAGQRLLRHPLSPLPMMRW